MYIYFLLYMYMLVFASRRKGYCYFQLLIKSSLQKSAYVPKVVFFEIYTSVQYQVGQMRVAC